MVKTMDFLLDIGSENNGYRIGEPWRFHELSLTAIIPLVRVTAAKRSYRLLSEVQDKVKIKDIGSINQMQITNNSDWPILVKSGEYVFGATQTRALTVSQVIMAKETVTVPCACVHSTKGIRADQTVRVDGYAPIMVRRIIYKGQSPSTGIQGRDRPDGQVVDTRYGYSSRLQQDIWGGVKSFSSKETNRVHSFRAMASSNHADLNFLSSINETYHSPEEDLAGRVKETEEKYSEILKKTPKLENQVGMALVAIDGLESLECFDTQTLSRLCENRY